MPETLTRPSAGPRPPWIKARLPAGETFERTREILDGLRLVTVCREALCPNVSECWGHGTATIMVLGDTCTRGCRFCAVTTGNPGGRTDPTEPERVAEAVRRMGMKYIVLTSVDRDDLPDGGASHFAACVRAIKRRSPEVKVETLIPDFRADRSALDILCASEPDVIAQNMETVERLTYYARDKRAGYSQTLKVLDYVKKARPHHFTKTGLMLGLGEFEQEIEQTMKDLRAVNVDILTLGQYLQPTKKHLPVSRYVTPEEFMAYGQMARALGFKAVASAPLVRSSYRADALI
ncbi:MAG: lipoyl synthase [bacterium]